MGRRGNSLLPLAAAGLAALVVALVCTGRRARGDDEDRDEKSSSASSAEGSGHVDTTGGDTKERSEGDATEHTNNPAAGKSPSSIAETVSSGSGAVLAESAAGNPPVGDRPHEVFFLYEGGRVSELRSKITRVRVALHVVEITDCAFRGCDKLVEVQLSEGLQIIGKGAFRGCTALRRVIVPSTVTELGNEAFCECSSLAKLELNEGLQVVGQIAFAECAALRSVAMPSTVTKLGEAAFYKCNNLVEVRLNEGLHIIGYSLFTECIGLRCVTIPSTVTELDEWVFRGCRNLSKVHLNEGLQTIGAWAFAECSALQNITLPSTVTKLDERVFYECRNLSEVKLNEGLQIIERSAFYKCTALNSMTLPSTVTCLGDDTFNDCSNLAEVNFNEGLQVIGGGAFEDCTALRSVTIPATVTRLGHWAFCDCRNLSKVTLLGGERLLDQGFFARGIFSEEQGLVNQEALDEMLFDEEEGSFAFQDCPLATVKISIPWALSERMAMLANECRNYVEERIRNLRWLELMLDGTVLACFPVVCNKAEDGSDDDAEDEAEDEYTYDIQDTYLETARSLYQVLQLIAFHELKESSILIELAMWKSRIEGEMVELRADCRVPIPDPVKSSIMEYCGFAGFLRPAIEGA